MRLVRTVGPYLVAFAVLVSVPAVAAAGDDSTMSSVPMAGKDSAGMAPSSVAPASAPLAQAPSAGKDSAPMAGVPMAGKDSAGMAPSSMAPSGSAPSGSAPASVVAQPARAGGLDPAATAMVLSSFGLLSLGGGVAVRRRWL